MYALNPVQAKKEIVAGDYYFKKPNYSAAERRYLEATRWDPGSEEGFRKLGEAREKLHEYGPAREAYLKYIAADRRSQGKGSCSEEDGQVAGRQGREIPQMTDKIVVFSSCDSEEQAGRIARALVEQRLAACVNILPGARSVYRWKGADRRRRGMDADHQVPA